MDGENTKKRGEEGDKKELEGGQGEEEEKRGGEKRGGQGLYKKNPKILFCAPQIPTRALRVQAQRCWEGSLALDTQPR